MRTEYNSEGIPLISIGSRSLISTTGVSAKNKIDTKPVVVKEITEDKSSTGQYTVLEWGTNNLFPETAITTIEKSTVLNSGLKYKLQLVLGQGVYPCRVKEFRDNGDEVLEVVNDPVLKDLVRSRMVRKYLTEAARDVYKFGKAFPVLRFNEDGSKIVAVNAVNARSCRLEFPDASTGTVKNVIITDWRQPKDVQAIPVLDPDDPDDHLQELKLAGKTKKARYIYPIDNYFSNNYFYPAPDWYTAYNAGWIDISQKVPSILKYMYENQITWKWHVKIPYAYFDKKFPLNQYKTVVERTKAIDDFFDALEASLIGTENANKAIFSMFEINAMGKAEEQWEIEALDNHYKSDQQLVESAVADSNILFSILVNPTVMGAGLPGEGPYAGKTGGSDIRESFLVNIALAWLDRQNILDPLDSMIRFNGAIDAELRFKNMLLTTLDTGAGSKKVLS